MAQTLPNWWRRVKPFGTAMRDHDAFAAYGARTDSQIARADSKLAQEKPSHTAWKIEAK